MINDENEVSRGRRSGTGAHCAVAPQVSIIIPTYGRRQFLAEAVASVAQQTCPDWELYIVDDASPTPVRKQDFPDPRIKVLRHERNKGPAAARNTGAKAARGKWLAFLDDDDLWDPRRIERALDWTACKQADICVVWTRPLGAAANHAVEGRNLEGNCHADIMTATIPSLCATMIRKEAFMAFNETYRACQDLEWWIRVSKHTRVTTVRMPLFIWRRHDGPRNKNSIGDRIKYSRRLLIDHHAYFAEYPAALAFRLFKQGYMLQRTHEYGAAARAYWRVAIGPHVAPQLRASAFKRLVEVLPRALLSRRVA